MRAAQSIRHGAINGPGYARAVAVRLAWLLAVLLAARGLVHWFATDTPCFLPEGPCGLWRLLELKLLRPMAVLVFVVSISSLTVRRLRDARLPASLILVIASFLLKDVGPLTGIVPVTASTAGLLPYVPAHLLAGLICIMALTIAPSERAGEPARQYGRLAYLTLAFAIVLVAGPDIAMLVWAMSPAAGLQDQGWMQLLVLAMQWRLTLNVFVLAGVALFATALAAIVAKDRTRPAGRVETSSG